MLHRHHAHVWTSFMAKVMDTSICWHSWAEGKTERQQIISCLFKLLTKSGHSLLVARFCLQRLSKCLWQADGHAVIHLLVTSLSISQDQRNTVSPAAPYDRRGGWASERANASTDQLVKHEADLFSRFMIEPVTLRSDGLSHSWCSSGVPKFGPL